MKAYAPSEKESIYKGQAIVSLLKCGLDITSIEREIRNSFFFLHRLSI